jgi:hypothetical protein
LEEIMAVATSTPLLIRYIELVIDFGDGYSKRIQISWRKGMTVLDALKNASGEKHGIAYRATMHSLGPFVTEIDGDTNDMVGKVRRGWMFWVNDEMPNVGCAEYELSPADIVRWVYTVYDQSATRP